jgi:nucleoside-diphosphate-sugar epimerase
MPVVQSPYKFTSGDKMSKILQGKYPGLPDIYVPVVDVGDVALAHVHAIIKQPPKGRYILVESRYCTNNPQV